MKKVILATVFVLVWGLVGSSSAALVAHYEFEGNANDSSGNGFDGTAYGGLGYVGGVFGKAISLDGVDDYVNCGTFNPSGAGGQLSVCLWAKWDGLNGRWQGLVAKRDTWAADNMMWQLEAHMDTGALDFKREGSYWYSGNPVLPVGEWSHVAATFDGTTCKLYVDGTQTGSGSFSLGSDPEAHVIIGATQPNGANAFAGDLDDVRIYNHALSAVAIRLLMEPPEAPSDAHSFTYQGRLLDADSPADGLYDFQFKLYDNPSILGNQQGETIHVNDVDVIDGYFAVELNFGSEVFDGNNRWLQIGVRQGDVNDPNEYIALSPLQQITPTPYAIYAASGTSGSQGDSHWQISGSDIYYNDGNVGIGTTSPGAELEVNGQVKITGGSPGAGKVLKSDANGLATWETFTAGAGDDLGDHTATENIRLNGHWLSGDGENEGVYVANNGNVGIGTTSPIQKLGVLGRAKIIGDSDWDILKVDNSGAGSGIRGWSEKGAGVYGESTNYHGVYGRSDGGADRAGVYGMSLYGYGVFGRSADGYAGYFHGRVQVVEGNLDVCESTSPGAKTITLRTDGGALAIEADNASLGIISRTGNTAIQPTSGSVSVGTWDAKGYKLAVNGSAAKAGGGSWSNYSDIRLKAISGNYEHGLSEITELNPMTYRYAQDNELELPTEEEYVGPVAQQVQSVIPEAVEENTDGYLMVNNDPIIWAMVNAIKELKAENDSLKQRLESLEKMVGRQQFASAEEVQ